VRLYIYICSTFICFCLFSTMMSILIYTITIAFTILFKFFFFSWTRIDVKRKESESLALDDLPCCQMNEGRMDCFSLSFFLLLLILSLDCRHQKTSKGRLDMVTFDAFSFSVTNACKRVKVNEKSLYVGNASSMLDLDGERANASVNKGKE